MLVGMSLSKPATQTVIAQQAEVLAGLPFTDTQDFEDANRGLVASIEDPVLTADGTVVWDNSTYDFLEGDAPDTVNARLWR